MPDLEAFFFQAEDGIRDPSVTGVQTCALPILMTHGAMLWGAALYNNGGFPIKDTNFGESYSANGAPQILVQIPPPTAEQKQIGRASCRESVRVSGGDGTDKRKAGSIGSHRCTR